jgi:hypothetical protein
VQSSASGDTRVLEHLLDIEYEPEVLNAPEDAFVSIKKIDAAGLLESQIQTTDWLKALGAAQKHLRLLLQDRLMRRRR